MLLDRPASPQSSSQASTAAPAAVGRRSSADMDLDEGGHWFRAEEPDAEFQVDDQVESADDAGDLVRSLGTPRTVPQAQPKPKAAPRKVGGNDALGRKENKLLQWQSEMEEVAATYAPQFEPLGLHFRPQILLATALQEADAKDPLNGISFDKGVGIMQITPYKGKLDPAVAKAINWDNSKSVSENIRTSNWRNAKANLSAGALTMLGKAKALRRLVPKVWEQMNENQRWRAVLFAYNAGESTAASALRRGGANAAMISTFTDPKGRRVSHDYTKELQDKLDYVESHDPFDGGSGTPDRTPEPEPTTDGAAPAPKPQPGGESEARSLQASVGRGGQNRKADVKAVQDRLGDRGVNAGPVDGIVGPKTIDGIEDFQQATIHMADGLIEPGKNTEKRLFGESGRVGGDKPAKDRTPAREPAPEPTPQKEPETDKGAEPKEQEHPSWAAISANFNAKISGTAFTWHEAFWLPSWSRHVRPSDVTNISIDQLIANVERQAAALTEVREALGKAIVVHCWVRPPAYNKQIGGASNSAHLRGMATDFHMPGLSAEQVRQAVKSRKLYPGAGENNVSWVHLDLEHSRWFNP